jgi:hypothetical protein
VAVSITLTTRPSLAFPNRWSVDWWYADQINAASQAATVTFESKEEAVAAADNIQATLEKQGASIIRSSQDSHVSRTLIPSLCATEEELTKNLEAYVKSAFTPLQKVSMAQFFDLTKWPKGLQAVTSKSPHILSLLFLLALLFGDSLQKLLEAVVPKELGLTGDRLLASAPLLLGIVTVHVYLLRVRMSRQMDRLRQWILQAAVSYGWDRSRFQALLHKEISSLEYASFRSFVEDLSRRDPNSLEKLTSNLGVQAEASDGQAEKLVGILLQGDFAKKIQALAGVAYEPGYQAKNLAIMPFHLIITFNSVRTNVLGLLGGGQASSVEGSIRFHEGMTLLGMMLGLVFSLLIVCPTLIWATVLSWHLSLVWFTLNVAASILTIWLLSARGLAVIIWRKYIPRGLYVHDCVGALHVM